MIKLSKNFTRSEFKCLCGCGFDTVDIELLRILENIRNFFDKPVHITSGCRCENHNQFVNGSRYSQHKKGRAADIIVDGIEPDVIADFAERLLSSGGVGRYSTFTHIDTRTNDDVVVWSAN